MLSNRTIFYILSCLVVIAFNASVYAASCTPGRKYTTGIKSVANLTGAESKVKTVYGKLCADSTGTNIAYQVAYANISKDGAKTIWAQSGWGKERNAGSKVISYYRYAEMNGDAYKVNYDTGNAPTDGTSHTYKVDLSPSTGKWEFSYDGSNWETFTDTAWKNTKGTSVQYTGEIYNKEDNMPGTASDKVNFTACKYSITNGSYQDAGLSISDLFSSDSTEWGVQWISSTSISIWDKTPLP